MKAWIARERNGYTAIFYSDPLWFKAESGRAYWQGEEIDLPEPLVNLIAQHLDLQPGHKQPVELTAAILGPAIQGDAT